MRRSGIAVKPLVSSVITALLVAIPASGSELSRTLTGEGVPSWRQIALGAVEAIGDPPIVYWTIGLVLLMMLIVSSLAPLFLSG